MSFELRTQDRTDPLWLRLVAHCEERVRELQAKLSGDLNQEDTWKYRGRIAELNAILERRMEPVKVELSDFADKI